MKRLVLLLVVLGSVLVLPEGAYALSCVPPEPVDWEQRFPTLDGAYIVRVERVEPLIDDERVTGNSVRIVATVEATLQGESIDQIEYTVPSFDPWGPYYEPGDDVAVTIARTVVADGRQNLCGPWFEPDELRKAASEYGELELPVPSVDSEPNPARPAPPTSTPVPSWSLLLDLIRLVLAVLGR